MAKVVVRPWLGVTGAAHPQYKHGMWGTRTYKSWRSMLDRCTNQNNDHWAGYGGRGIAVSAAWVFYENFFADMGERPEGLTLDRIDVDGNYEPGNCRWATASEQQRNKRPMPRGDTCAKGHAYTEFGVYVSKRGRQCKECALQRARARRELAR